jgi:hypothetical protein
MGVHTVMDTTRQNVCIRNHDNEGAVADRAQKTQCQPTTARKVGGAGISRA